MNDHRRIKSTLLAFLTVLKNHVYCQTDGPKSTTTISTTSTVIGNFDSSDNSKLFTLLMILVVVSVALLLVIGSVATFFYFNRPSLDIYGTTTSAHSTSKSKSTRTGNPNPSNSDEPQSIKSNLADMKSIINDMKSTELLSKGGSEVRLSPLRDIPYERSIRGIDSPRLSRPPNQQSAIDQNSSNDLIKNRQMSKIPFNDPESSLSSKDFSTFPVSAFQMSSSYGNSATIKVTDDAVFLPGHMEINPERDIEIDESNVIGEGGFAVVKRAKLNIQIGSRNDIVVKIFATKNRNPTVTPDLNNLRSEFILEVAIMALIPQYPYVVELLGYSIKPYMIVMKYYASDLSKVTIKSPGFICSPAFGYKVAFEVASAMNHIHSYGVLHLDLKPQNILLDIQPDNDTFKCVLCDFGVASLIGMDERVSVAGVNLPTNIGFSHRYAAPEILNDIQENMGRSSQLTDKKKDVYSYSITLYECVHGCSAWKGLENRIQILDAVKRGRRPEIDANILSRFKASSQSFDSIFKVIEKCWGGNPNERPHFPDILELLRPSLSQLPPLSSIKYK